MFQPKPHSYFDILSFLEFHYVKGLPKIIKLLVSDFVPCHWVKYELLEFFRILDTSNIVWKKNHQHDCYEYVSSEKEVNSWTQFNALILSNYGFMKEYKRSHFYPTVVFPWSSKMCLHSNIMKAKAEKRENKAKYDMWRYRKYHSQIAAQFFSSATIDNAFIIWYAICT